VMLRIGVAVLSADAVDNLLLVHGLELSTVI